MREKDFSKFHCQTNRTTNNQINANKIPTKNASAYFIF